MIMNIDFEVIFWSWNLLEVTFDFEVIFWSCFIYIYHINALIHEK